MVSSVNVSTFDNKSNHKPYNAITLKKAVFPKKIH